MRPSSRRPRPARPARLLPAAALAALAALAACAACARAPKPASGGAPVSPAEIARADSGRPPFTEADVRFMTGMIHHHAQALVMAAMALDAAHGASPAVRTLAGRINVGQKDEIGLVSRWLADRRLPVPDVQHAMMGHPSAGSGQAMGGMEGMAMMPGMLTHEQLMELDAARGADFDRAFLTFMIRHHEGAVTMVHELFGARGAGNDITVFKFASDVEADQTTEIDRMQSMLRAVGR